jgi:hypothetical protein
VPYSAITKLAWLLTDYLEQWPSTLTPHAITWDLKNLDTATFQTKQAITLWLVTSSGSNKQLRLRTTCLEGQEQIIQMFGQEKPGHRLAA